ncbi:LytTR family DNA-binding domain-containing protein [Marinilabilia salmonicolor]|uniref:LytTR family two component transcriptional regulator n=1 Tax=Marinilabilia salmonicolor TaxID=989 RepID=A0A368V0D3_9BACT|nr:LytTR family DNA-binding domain-containing protein [Marinilabilia salmonicolor]RCW34519.1 LytTR family two component transcriptional regulator [Marinilabilia salmonicolor]
MRILIVEDEFPTRRLLKDSVKKIRPEWEIIGESDSVEGTIEFLQKNPQPDLIFMDIQLSDGSSFEIFEKTEVTGMIIFTTAYDEYAIQAFKVNSIDYLLKPINQKKLTDAIEKYERLFQDKEIPSNAGFDYGSLSKLLASQSSTYRSRLLTNLADGFQKVDTEKVAWLVSANKITTAVTFDSHHHIVDFTLDKLEKELDPTMFFRANRQYIVNIDAIHKVENWFNGKLIVKTKPDAQDRIVVSRERARSFKEWINQ